MSLFFPYHQTENLSAVIDFFQYALHSTCVDSQRNVTQKVELWLQFGVTAVIFRQLFASTNHVLIFMTVER
jgi:hypothetical protein